MELIHLLLGKKTVLFMELDKHFYLLLKIMMKLLHINGLQKMQILCILTIMDFVLDPGKT